MKTYWKQQNSLIPYTASSRDLKIFRLLFNLKINKVLFDFS